MGPLKSVRRAYDVRPYRETDPAARLARRRARSVARDRARNRGSQARACALADCAGGRRDVSGAAARGPAAEPPDLRAREVGRAACRERDCTYAEISVGAVSLTQKRRTPDSRPSA